MKLFDTHCHLNHPLFEDDREEVLVRARAAGIARLLTIGYDLDSSRRAAALADPSSGLLASVGIHPHSAGEWDASVEAELRTLARREGVIALGEIGLDFYRNLSPRQTQVDAFRAQLALAGELGLPVVIHTRESLPETLAEVLPAATKGIRGVFHCWSGDPAQARQVRDAGWLLGIGGVVTYRRADELREVVRAVGIDGLLLETDAPYLPPEPHRGRRNEPAYLALVAEKVAGILGSTVDEVAARTSASADWLFGGERGHNHLSIGGNTQ